ncbi:Retrovirus-related Pol polyprotein [Labeo rohita]|uniref:Retrovirus-related Pol polyprotein n=1 Tax=Labeo rohita TaxID=84645 RepID=A0ABQ8MKT0_LABRO|nr:Retrovirus-related Pol polyprotein [Labeo rohita]
MRPREYTEESSQVNLDSSLPSWCNVFSALSARSFRIVSVDLTRALVFDAVTGYRPHLCLHLSRPCSARLFSCLPIWIHCPSSLLALMEAERSARTGFAEGSSLQSALELQGAMLGRHEQELSSTRHSVDNLSAQFAGLVERLDHLALSGFASTPSTVGLSPLSSEPRNLRIGNFKSGVRHFFAYRQSAQMGYRCMGVTGQEASRLLASIQQGRRSVADYSVEFRTVEAATSGWNAEALVARFLEGLNDAFKNELKKLRRRARMRTEPVASTPLAPSSDESEPMQVNRLRLTAKEKQRRLLEGLCLYCAAQGHHAQSCPVKQSCPPQRVNMSGTVISSTHGSCTKLSVSIITKHASFKGSALIDSGAEGNFIDEEWARPRGILLQPLPSPIIAHGFYGRPLMRLSQITDSVSLLTSGNHREELRFLVCKSPSAPMVLGHLWLTRHGPKKRWISPGYPPATMICGQCSAGPERSLSHPIDRMTVPLTSSQYYSSFLFSSWSGVLLCEKEGWLSASLHRLSRVDITVKNRYPLPLMSSAFDLLQGAEFFTKLDLRNAYHLVWIREGDEWKTAFNTPRGHFEYRVLPFGLSNAPTDHVQHVRQVLQWLLENQLFVKAEKCEFHVKSVSFLGHIISVKGIRMDPAKELRTGVGPFDGVDLHQDLIQLVGGRPSGVDASEVGVGAVLSQVSPLDNKLHPCAFFSHRLSPAERNYDISDRELLAVRLALGEWRHWLEGVALPFLVWTDHKNLEYIRSARRLNARQAHWALFFGRFDFTLSYRPGSKNAKPDALTGRGTVRRRDVGFRLGTSWTARSSMSTSNAALLPLSRQGALLGEGSSQVNLDSSLPSWCNVFSALSARSFRIVSVDLTRALVFDAVTGYRPHLCLHLCRPCSARLFSCLPIWIRCPSSLLALMEAERSARTGKFVDALNENRFVIMKSITFCQQGLKINIKFGENQTNGLGGV